MRREQSEETPGAAPEGIESALLAERAETIGRLYREHNRALISFLTARLHSEQDARDVAQEAYVRLLRLEKPGALGFLRGYLFKTAANLAIDRVRQRAVRNHVTTEEALEELEEPLAPERQLLAEQQLDRIARTLEALPAQCRHAFAMHVLLERPVRDIASELGISDRMVRYHIVRGLMHCRKTIGEDT